jgi:methylglyoxal synthase
MVINEKPKRRIAIFASPKCTVDPKLYKAYFNVAWFVQAYREVLEDYEILTTPETQYAVEEAFRKVTPKERREHEYWEVPTGRAKLQTTKTRKPGFDGMVQLAGAVARREVERVLMFMDPLDTKEYLPETYAFIRNCTLADVGLHINLGATYWAESVTPQSTKEKKSDSFGGWRTGQKRDPHPTFSGLLNPDEQTVHFIAHDTEKEKLSKFVYHYRNVLAERQRTGWTLSGTSRTSDRIKEYLADRIAPYWETPSFKAAGAGTTGHGPTGGDVVIADEICNEWPVEEPVVKPEKEKDYKIKITHEVRERKLSHTVLFFIDYYHAQPHEADIHVLLRTCLNPHRGIHLILNERTAIEWGETIREGCFSKSGPRKRLDPADQRSGPV